MRKRVYAAAVLVSTAWAASALGGSEAFASTPRVRITLIRWPYT